jgi:hypothetical protein
MLEGTVQEFPNLLCKSAKLLNDKAGANLLSCFAGTGPLTFLMLKVSCSNQANLFFPIDFFFGKKRASEYRHKKFLKANKDQK